MDFIKVYDEKSLSEIKISILYFTAKWCGPCKKIKPFVNKLAEKLYEKIDFYIIDIDDHGDLADQFDITSIPTFYAVKHKNVLQSITTSNEKELENFIELVS